eukprot:TRINITY_DN14722_c0_g2_i2.p1 TRINITY_DN14722_c0_g2~~TRINITY_DN14722_c0_g2_i2.p1  ORF type:complete len:482 (-),score=40.38 TRINITY_DN14722_c0_g2_i2:227-1672(-)
MSFSDLTAIELPVVTFGAYMLCLNFYFLLRSLSRELIWNVAKSCVEYLRDMAGARHYDKFDAIFHSRVQLRREKHVHGVCTVLTVLFSSVFVFLISSKLMDTDRYWSRTQEVTTLFMYFVVTLLRARPFLARGCCAYFFYFLMMTCTSCVGGSVSDSYISILYTYARVGSVRFLVSVSCLNPGLVLAVNSSCCVVVVCANKFLRPLNAENFELIVKSEIVITLLISASSFLYQVYVHTDVRQELDAAEHKIEQSAVTGLLDAVCDVNFALDETLHIKEHSERFAAMMMLPSSRSLRGADIRDFMPNEQDKTRVRMQLSRFSSGENLTACALNLSMRDSDRSELHVEMLSVPFIAIDDSIHFMVGIREVVDTTRLASLPSSLAERSEAVGDRVSPMQSGNATSPRIPEDFGSDAQDRIPTRPSNWYGTPPTLTEGSLSLESFSAEFSRGSTDSSFVESDLQLPLPSTGEHPRAAQGASPVSL